MKKTAIEWLTEKLRTEFGFAFSNNILEQAKEIEKKQLNDAINYDRPFLCCWEDNSAFEEYYNQTFKNK